MNHGKLILQTNTFLQKKQGVIIHATALFFLVAGLVYSLYLGNDLRFPDERKYYSLAVNLVEGNGFSFDGKNPTAFFPPGYPFFLSIFIKLGASKVFLRYLNFIALTLCIYMSKAILRRENVDSGATLSALLLVGYVVLFYAAGRLYPQILFSLMLMLLFWLASGPEFTFSHAIMFGLLSTIMILFHSTAIFIPPLFVLWMLYPKNWIIIKKAAVSALIVVACISIWAYRNHKIFDTFIPLSTHGWDTFWAGNNPNADVMGWHKSMTKKVIDQAKRLDEAEREQFYRKRALAFWKENPATGLKLYILKLLNHFNFQNDFYMESEFSRTKSIIMFVTYYPLLFCFVIRLFFVPIFPISRVEALFILLYIVSALFHAIFITRIRFRLPYDVLLITHIGFMFSKMADAINPE